MSRIRLALAWAASVVLAVGAIAGADEARKTQDPTAGIVYKARALHGIAFRNDSNENLGKLYDLMVDQNGRIVYGILSHGGVGSIGDKLFAVPPEALHALTEVNGKNQFTLAVSKQKLDSQPGFNEKDYPTAPDPIFRATDKSSTIERRTEASSAGDVRLMRLSKLDGTPVRNQAGEDCGKVRDFIVSLHNARVESAIIGYGGVTRLGEKYFAAPWSALELKSLTGKPSEVCFVTHVSKQTLDNNPGFDKNGFPTPKDLDLFRHRDGGEK
jgi:sporulation protein YlmC with PRC-barrel domain